MSGPSPSGKYLSRFLLSFIDQKHSLDEPIGIGDCRGMTTAAPPAAAAPRLAEGSKGRPETAVLLVLGSCTSFQFGAALATRLFPVTGAVGATLLRLGLAAIVLLAITRPRVRGWSRARLAVRGPLRGQPGRDERLLLRRPRPAAAQRGGDDPVPRPAHPLGGAVAPLARRLLDRARAARRPDPGWPTRWQWERNGGLDPVGVALGAGPAAFWALYIVAGSGPAPPSRPQRGRRRDDRRRLVLLPSAPSAPARWSAGPAAARLRRRHPRLGRPTARVRRHASAPRQVFGILLSLDPAWRRWRAGCCCASTLPVAIAAVAVVITASVGSTLSAREPSPLP